MLDRPGGGAADLVIGVTHARPGAISVLSARTRSPYTSRMRARIALAWTAALSLEVACADDAPAIATTLATTHESPSSSGVATSPGGSTEVGADSSSSAGPGSTSGPITGGPITSGPGGTSGPVTSGEGSSSGDASSSGGVPLPGCGDAPPADFHAEPSAPAADANIPGPMTALEVTIGGEILAEATAKFYLREVHTLTDADDFTIVILPDTQNYTQFPGNFPQYPAQTQWVWDHRNTDRIVAVLHNGDVVQHGNTEEVEWQRADTAMTTLETITANFLDGMPYGVAVGNHDNGAYVHDDKPFSTSMFNKYFGVARFKGRAYYGGHYGDKNDNSWILVRAGNLDVLMVNLEYRGVLGQDPKVLAWAKGVFDAHPDALGIVNSHHIVKANGDFSGEGKQIYNAVKSAANVQLMTSGHIKEIRARRTDTFMGRKIHSMLADYQDLIVKADDCAGGCGYMRIWRFSPKQNQLKVETYSPSLKKSMTGPQEQFTLAVDLSAATGVFAAVGTTSGPGAALSYAVDDLKPGAAYEWYAVVKECGAKVTTPTRTFTVQ